MSTYISLLLFLLLSGCNITAVNKAEKAKIYDDFITTNKLTSLKKITSFRLQNFISLDNRHLIISTTPTKSYLISLMSYCTDLQYANHIGIKRSIASVLSVKFDAILVPEIQNEKCYIKSIHQLTNDQVDALSHLVKDSP